MSDAVVVEDVLKQFGTEDNLRPRLKPSGLNGQNGHTSSKLAVDRVSFSVRPGEIFGLVGPNGSGKSTLIRLIAARLIPDEGQITVFGHDVAQDPHQVKNYVNGVPFESGFFDNLSPMENLTYDSQLHGPRVREIGEHIVEILTRLGLDMHSIFSPMQYMSNGMLQKVKIARALLGQPRLLLLEEPTMGLDPRSKRELSKILLELRELRHTTILLTTHDLVVAEVLCDRIAIIHDGQIVALDTLENLKKMSSLSEQEPTLEGVYLELTGRSFEENG